MRIRTGLVGSPRLYGADVAGGLINRHCAGSHHLYGADLGPIPRAQKQKSACIAIFLRLGTVTGFLIADWDAKTQVIGCTVALFRSEGTKKSPQSQKSCKEAEIFVFVIVELP